MSILVCTYDTCTLAYLLNDQEVLWALFPLFRLEAVYRYKDQVYVKVKSNW